MMLGKLIAVCCENRMESENTAREPTVGLIGV